ncbi:HNT2 [Candida oxycetoniae]|uniref:Bis(5'-adenosyl)-triphosphatase n=1 Tax=Candida oxycetoniae TaxID=497107 RepID=A0AAI9T076_9ASCO|nr:HNT2 [Candida oxycetoniae]KAI3406199.2 HNT2 [Candida oxycetoniae]
MSLIKHISHLESNKDSRALTVKRDSRALTVKRDSRALTVKRDSRALTVKRDSRALTVKRDSRALTVKRDSRALTVKRDSGSDSVTGVAGSDCSTISLRSIVFDSVAGVVNKQVFYQSKFTYALVNLKPLVPGHVLVVPLRTSVLRFGDLTSDESADYMATLQLIHKFIINTYHADSLNIAIQDGPESGQSVPHLHTHIIPRYRADGYGDSIYKKLENFDWAKNYQEFELRKREHHQRLKENKNELDQKDQVRIERSQEEMESEANRLKRALENFKSRYQYTSEK